jgi:hypothetical protein
VGGTAPHIYLGGWLDIGISDVGQRRKQASQFGIQGVRILSNMC